MASEHPLCADCDHEIGYHDPCSKCAAQGRTCRAYVTSRSKQAKPRRDTPGKRRR